MQGIWAASYMDIPFTDLGRSRDGCDCYGMILMILKECANVRIPDLTGMYKDIQDVRTIKKIVDHMSAQESMWTKIERGNETEFDIVVCRIVGLPIHVGIVTRKGWMLHTIDGVGPSEVEYTKGEWKAPGKIIGFYRHKELCRT